MGNQKSDSSVRINTSPDSHLCISNLEWEMYQVSTLGDIAGMVEEASRIDAETVWEMVKLFNSCSVDMQVEILFSCSDVVARRKKSSEENVLARKLIDKLDAV